MMPYSPKRNNNLTLMLAGLLLATLSASTVNVVLGLSTERLLVLIMLMTGTGGISLVVGYVLYDRRTIRLMHSLRMSLMVNTVMVILILLVNVLVIGLSMFITEFDPVLITSLLVFATIMAIIFGVVHARLLTEELGKIALAIETLGEDNTATTLPLFGNDELAGLTAAFNKMTERLREAERQKRTVEKLRRDLIAWVSHDLRTPLTSLRAMNEALIDGVVTHPDQVTLYLQEMNREITALGNLIDDMFELSLLDTQQPPLQLQKTSLRDLLSGVLESMTIRAARQHIIFHVEIKDQDIDPVLIAPDKIQRVLHNLLDNAFQHTNSGGEIRITAWRAEPNVLIEVFNSGSLITATDLPRIFEEFYRADKARRATEGNSRHAGLGLAIAQRFIEAHGGKIWAESRVDDGTSFYFTLPHPDNR